MQDRVRWNESRRRYLLEKSDKSAIEGEFQVIDSETDEIVFGSTSPRLAVQRALDLEQHAAFQDWLGDPNADLEVSEALPLRGNVA